MTIINIEDLPKIIKESPNKPLMGIDLGTKTIGIAISDLGLKFANPRLTIKRKKFAQDAEELINFINKENICAIIIGLPINMDGSFGARTQSTKAFIRNMNQYTNLPFILQDERLSTVTATRTLLEFDFSRKKRSQLVDANAAAVILQASLDRLHFLTKDQN